MTDLSPASAPPTLLPAQTAQTPSRSLTTASKTKITVRPTYPQNFPPQRQFTHPLSRPLSRPLTLSAPRSGSQLYHQRLVALQVGQIHTRLPQNSFEEAWRSATQPPTYEQWRRLLSAESQSIARRHDRGNLAVLLGDSLSLWFPNHRLPTSSTWLNQGISGETTRGILNRSADLNQARPDTIYIMAGVNDLKRGISDREILQNLNTLVQRLRQRQPQAQIVLQSILPTRSALIPNDRIARLNHWIARLAQRQSIYYLDTHSYFAASDGYLKANLTTDGIHLNENGYATWQAILRQSETYLAQRPTVGVIATR